MFWSERYRYRIEDIEPGFRNGAPSGTIVYKQIGCRTIFRNTVSDLNNQGMFSMFRADHAQVIVTLATLEAVLSKKCHDAGNAYSDYLSTCIKAIRERRDL